MDRALAYVDVPTMALLFGIDGAVDWRTHARVGIPVTMLTLLLAGASLWVLP